MAYFNFMKSVVERAETKKMSMRTYRAGNCLEKKVAALGEMLNLSKKSPTTNKIASTVENTVIALDYNALRNGLNHHVKVTLLHDD